MVTDMKLKKVNDAFKNILKKCRQINADWKTPLQTQSNNQFIQHENLMNNNAPSFNFNNCTVTINYAGK
jgi:hypothetical protein